MTKLTNKQNKICWFCAIGVVVTIYLAAAFWSTCVKVIDPNEYVSPGRGEPAILKPLPPGEYKFKSGDKQVYTWNIHIPDEVIAEIIANYLKGKQRIVEEAEAQYEAAKAEIAERNRESLPIEQQMPAKDKGKRYSIYEVSLYLDPSRSMDKVGYEIGIGSYRDAIDKMVHVKDRRVFIGQSESSTEKMNSLIRTWRTSANFNFVVVNDIKHEINMN